MTWRGGPATAVASVLFLMLPNVREDLSRAWAEGPLLLGFGICAFAYRSRWFGPACGVAATFKLTALGLWPLLLLRRAHGGARFGPTVGLLAALLVWTILTPPAWYGYGPGYLVHMVVDRATETPGHVSLTEAGLSL
jgi:hypothetical protein